MLINKNKVSVVLCTYNGSRYLEKQLNSILNQSYEIEEIIIVDDCSTDSTRDILVKYHNEYSKIKLFFNEKNLGSNDSFKYAVSLATNDYIALCDQDDIWYTNKIEVQMHSIVTSIFFEDGKPLVSFHDLCLMDQNDTITHQSFWKLHKFNPFTFTFRKSLIFNIVTGCTCIINKKMMEEMIKCDMRDIIMHDYLIALIGYGFGNIIYINEPLMYYRSHVGTVTEKETVSITNRIRSFVKRVKSGTYLMPNIIQIQKFNELYGSFLAEDKKKLVADFIKLKDDKSVHRMFYKWLIN